MVENPHSPKPKRRRPQGKTPTEVRSEITPLYQNTPNGTALAEALKARQYTLLKSTRNVIFIIDPQGGEHNLINRINAPKEEIKNKLADLNPKTLPLKKSRERQTHIKCFLTDTEKTEIKSRAEKAELSESGYLRSLVFGKQNQPKASRRPAVEKEQLIAIRYELRKIAGELNRIANAHHQSPGFYPLAFEKLCSDHENALKAIMTALSQA